jgi:hypothetical protein
MFEGDLAPVVLKHTVMEHMVMHSRIDLAEGQSVVVGPYHLEGPTVLCREQVRSGLKMVLRTVEGCTVRHRGALVVAGEERIRTAAAAGYMHLLLAGEHMDLEQTIEALMVELMFVAVLVVGLSVGAEGSA